MFCYSSQYTLECIIPNLSFLLNERIEQLYIYQDESYQRVLYTEAGFEIIIKSQLDEILAESDLIIIIDDGFVYNEFINRIEAMCTETNKKHLKFSISPNSKGYRSTASEYKLPNKKPVVLLCYDEASKIEQLEISLNRLFYESHIRVNQIFSDSTRSIVSNIRRIAKKAENIDNIDTENEYDVIVITISLRHIMSDNPEVYKDIVDLKPDYVLFCAQHNFSQFEALENLFKYKYMLKIDIILLSRYIFFVENQLNKYRIKTSLPHKNHGLNHVIAYESMTDKTIHNQIIAKLTSPSGVVFLN